MGRKLTTRAGRRKEEREFPQRGRIRRRRVYLHKKGDDSSYVIGSCWKSDITAAEEMALFARGLLHNLCNYLLRGGRRRWTTGGTGDGARS